MHNLSLQFTPTESLYLQIPTDKQVVFLRLILNSADGTWNTLSSVPMGNMGRVSRARLGYKAH